MDLEVGNYLPDQSIRVSEIAMLAIKPPKVKIISLIK